MNDYRKKLGPETSRSDAYPEFVDYRDEGCDLHPSCLRCPERQCRYDYDQGSQMGRENRQEAIAKLCAQGLDRQAIIRQLNISPRTYDRLKPS